MNKIEKIEINAVPTEFNTLRDKGARNSNSYYRQLTAEEIDILETQKNRSTDWSTVLVTDTFQVNQVKSCHFSGLVRIDDMAPISLVFHDLVIPTGLYNSHIISSDIGKHNALHNVGYMSHYILGDEIILKDINELITSDRSKFGNGIVKEGENPNVRIELEIANEAGGREILPFDKLRTPDAYLWYKYRGNHKLMERFREIVDSEYEKSRGEYGTIGDRTIIKNTKIIKDVKIGTDAYIKGANKLKNLTIISDSHDKTQIGEGCELVNGIIGEGCKIFYGAMAVRFQLLPHSSLKYGARLLNSVLGENSTISCCEVLNSFIFPGHEQHHNNSFLIASVLMGQTNIASGATIGSNHNTRKNDGEIVAGRGFWPGLNCSLKHNSKFASYNIIVKGSYPSEINCPLPFSLVSLNKEGGVQLFPGYWFTYNMYALKRNSWKYELRDERTIHFPDFEYDFLAPDTIIEMIDGIHFIEDAALESYTNLFPNGETNLTGKELLQNYSFYDSFPITSDQIENKNPKAKILKADVAVKEYKKMLKLFIVDSVISYCENGGSVDNIDNNNYQNWINCGGQLIPEFRVTQLISDIVEKKWRSWDEIHEAYKEFSNLYSHDKYNLAISVVQELYGVDVLTSDLWNSLTNEAITIRTEMKERVIQSRVKDYESDFKSMVYETEEEMAAVLGEPQDDPFFAIEEQYYMEFLSRTKGFMLEKR